MHFSAIFADPNVTPAVAPFAFLDDALGSGEDMTTGAFGDFGQDFGAPHLAGSPGFGVVGYQGSKRRYAATIVDKMEQRFGKASTWGHFYDLCCGTASVATEVARRAPNVKITVADMGPWGGFWREFQAARPAMLGHLKRLMSVRGGRGSACRALLGVKPSPSGALWAAQFLVVQGGSFYGRPPGDWKTQWRTTCVPATKGGGTGGGTEKLLGALAKTPRFTAVHGRAETVKIVPRSVVYIDPDYLGTAGYKGNHCPVPQIVQKALAARAKVAVSHHQAYPGLVGPVVTVTGKRCLLNVCRREVLIFPTSAKVPA